jgi:hypothetical protein
VTTCDLDLIRELLDPTTTEAEARRLAPGPTLDPSPPRRAADEALEEETQAEAEDPSGTRGRRGRVLLAVPELRLRAP